MRFSVHLIRCGALMGAALLFTGCVTRGYKLADKNTPPPVALNLSSAPASALTPPAEANSTASIASAAAATPVEAMVRTVIVYQGPGSWKREAYWDEYVITLTNRGAAPLVVNGATLFALNGESTPPGEDPWKLERIGKSWWQSNAGDQTRTYLLLGGGTIAGAGVATVAVLSGGIFAPLTGAAAAGATLGAAAVVTLPLVALGSVGMNIHRKHQVEAEFKRRRLVLPLTLAPGQSVDGSLFFRATPSPRELTLHTGVGGAAGNVTVSLAPLASLHLRMPIVPAAKAKPETSSVKPND